MNKTLIAGAILALVSTGAMAKKPVMPDDSYPYSFLAAVDATDKTVAVVTNGYWFTKITDGTVTVQLAPSKDEASEGQYAIDSLKFELEDCVGQPYVGQGGEWVFLSIGIDGTGYSYPDPNGVPLRLLIRSELWPDGRCASNTTGRYFSGLVAPIPADLDIVPPVRLDLR